MNGIICYTESVFVEWEFVNYVREKKMGNILGTVFRFDLLDGDEPSGNALEVHSSLKNSDLGNAGVLYQAAAVQRYLLLKKGGVPAAKPG